MTDPIDLTSLMGDGLRESLGLDKSWTYRDLPWMKTEYYEQMMDAIGEDNFRFVSGSSRVMGAVGGKTQMIRVTLFINEQGLANLRKLAEEIRT